MHLNLKSNKSKPHGYEESFRPIDPRWSSTPVLGKYSAFKQHHKDKLHSAADSQNKFHSTLLLEVWLLCGTINAQDKQARLTVSSARKFILTSNLNQALFNTWVEVSKWHIKSPKYCQCACSILFLQSYINSSEHTSTASTVKLSNPAHGFPTCTSISSQTSPSLMVMRSPSGLSIQDGRQRQCSENIQRLNSITRTSSTQQQIRRTSSILHSCWRCDFYVARLTLKTSKRGSQCLVHASSSSLQTWIKLYSTRE